MAMSLACLCLCLCLPRLSGASALGLSLPLPPLPLPTVQQSDYMDREVGGLITWALNANSSGVRACSGCAW